MNYTVLFVKNSNAYVENLWVNIRDQDSKGIFVVHVYYRPLDQGMVVDEELPEASCS